jgi:hypothetical protein
MQLFDKNSWKKQAQQFLYSNHPEYVPLFSSKIINATCHYMAGYAECVSENANHPHNLSDMQQAVSEAGIGYAIKLIKQGEES